MVVFSAVAFGQSTLPNGGFENWYWAVHPTHPNGGFWEPSGGFFESLNILDTIPTPPGLTCYPTDSVHTGDSAARLVTRKIDILNIVIPGVLGTLKINWVYFNAIIGKPFIYSTKPLRFQGYYMSFPVNNDSSGVVLLLSKWNSGTHKRDTIAFNELIFKGPVTTYTLFDTAVNYRDNVTMPDTLTILLLSSAGFNAVQMTQCKGQVGSTAYFDDITLTNINGIPTLLMPDVSVKLFPVPASERMIVELDKNIANGVFEIYDVQGKFLSSQQLKAQSSGIDVSKLSPGTYYYKVRDQRSILNTGTFVVSR